MKKRIKGICLFFLLLFLVSCKKEQSMLIREDKRDYKEELLNMRTKGNKELLLVHRFNQTPVLYNFEQAKIEQVLDIPNCFIYSFPEGGDYFTIGDSEKFGFSIVKRTKERFYLEKKMGEKEGIFPLTQSDGGVFFIKKNYEYGTSKSVIVQYSPKTKGIVELKKTLGFVAYGAIVDEMLYYTRYEEDSNTYTLFSLPVKKATDSPQEVKKGLESGEIYAQNGVLYQSNKTEIFSKTKRFKKGSANYFVGKGTLVKYQIIEDASLVASVIDVESGKEIFVAKDVVDFALKDKKIVFYCQGAIQECKYK